MRRLGSFSGLLLLPLLYLWMVAPSTGEGVMIAANDGPRDSQLTDIDLAATQDCGFYNVIEIDDPTGDASPGAPAYVDVKKLTIRQYGPYVQFAWEANGNPYNDDHQYYFFIMDTDFNPNTGQRWDGAGGEFKIAIYHTATLIYFDEEGNVLSEEYDLPVNFENNKFYLNVEKQRVPADHFNLYFESSGETPYRDSGSLNDISLQPAEGEISIVVESDDVLLPDKPPLFNIPDKSAPVQLNTYLVQEGVKTLLPSNDFGYTVYHPVTDPRVGDPSSIISVDSDGVARYLREGYVFVTAYSNACHLQSERVILATGEAYGNPRSDSVIAVFPPDYQPEGSQYSFGYMMTNYPNYMRTVNLAYDISSNLYNSYRPFNGDKQIFALLVEEGHCGGNMNPLETAPCCYMNCGNGTPNYDTVTHEMGHNFAYTRGMSQLTWANSSRIGRAGFGECVASLPINYIRSEFYYRPEDYGITTVSFEWNYSKEKVEADIPYAQSQLDNFEALIRSGQTTGVFDNDGLFDGVAVFCSFFQSYSYGFTHDTNLYGNETIRRFLSIFDDRDPPDFQEDKVETYFGAAYSVAVGQDVRDKLRFWGFNIDDAYYEQIHKNISVPFYDFNKNGIVDIFDVQTIARAWAGDDLRFDVNGDGDIDVMDIMRVGAHWSESFYWQAQWELVGERSDIARSSMAGAYDSNRQVTVLFGGRSGFNSTSSLADTLEYDGSSWQSVITAQAPARRYWHSMTYDNRRNHLVLFGGVDGNTLFDNTWEYDGSNWSQISTDHSPPARRGASMVYDSCRGKTVLFGGHGDSGDLADTWEYDGTDWVQAHTETSPPARTLAAMAFDSRRCRVVLFGSGPDRDDTWEYDGSSWTQVEPETSPPGRWAHAMVYDPSRWRIVLFGGYSPAVGSQLADTWEYDGNNWVQALPNTSPTAREQHTMIYDLGRRRVVMFGGFRTSGGIGGDTWEYGR